MNRATLKPRAALPHMERIEHFAWREGWFQGIAVGFVLGMCIAVVAGLIAPHFSH